MPTDTEEETEFEALSRRQHLNTPSMALLLASRYNMTAGIKYQTRYELVHPK